MTGVDSDDLTNTRVITQNVVSGQTFSLRYRAYNIFGWSDPSEAEEIIASSTPTEPLNIVTANNEATTSVTVSWDAPLDFGGDGIQIESYLISIYD